LGAGVGGLGGVMAGVLLFENASKTDVNCFFITCGKEKVFPL
jgi:hypothetical protein